MRRITTLLAGGLLGVAWASSALAEVSFRVDANSQVLFTDADVVEMQAQREGTVIGLRVNEDIVAQVAAETRGGESVEIVVDGAAVGTASVRASDESVVLFGMNKNLADHTWNTLGVTGAPGNAPKISVEPSTHSVQPGGVFTVDVYIDGAVDLRLYQIRVAATNATAGRLVPSELVIDQARSDYIYGGVDAGNLISASDQLQKRMGGLLINGSVNGAGYLGTYTFPVSPDVSGDIYVSIEVGEETFLRSEDAQPIPYRLGEAAIVSTGARAKLREGRPTQK